MQTTYLKPNKSIAANIYNSSKKWKVKQVELSNRYQRWRNLASRYELRPQGLIRLEWMIFYEKIAGGNAQKTCEHFGIGRSLFYRWKSRFQESGYDVQTLQNRSSRPKTVRKWQVSFIEESRIIKLRKQYIHWSKYKLLRLYKNKYHEYMTTWKIERVIRKHQLFSNKKRAQKLVIKRKNNKIQNKQRIQQLTKKSVLWFLIQLDGIVIYFNKGKRYIFTAVDHASKFAYARMYNTKSSKSARDFLHRLLYVINHPVQNLQTDEGSEFKGFFQKAIHDLNLTRFFSRVRCPKDNSQIERFNRTLKYEWMFDSNFTPDCETFNRNLTNWLYTYNFVRPHQSLDYLNPIEYITNYCPNLSYTYSANTVTSHL